MRWFTILVAIPLVPLLAGPPDARRKARELLDSAVETSSSASPEVAACAMLYAGENYDLFDHKKALEYLGRAFASTVAIPPGDDARKSGLQARIATATAALSLPTAIEMLKQIQPADTGYGDPRQQPVAAIISHMIIAKQFDEAIDLVNSVGSIGAYPFSSARQIFEKLAPDDGRRLAIFGYAMSAYSLRPGKGFSDFLVRHWKEIPKTTAEAAVQAVVENILSQKSDGFLSETISAGKGSVSLHSRQESDLFDLMHVVREIDPKRADEILETRPELKAALLKFPDGRLSMGSNLNTSSTSGSGQPDPAAEQHAALDGLSNTRAGQAAAAITAHNLVKALDIAKTIPLPERRVRVLTSIAGAAAADDPGIAKSIIGECVDLLKDVKDPDQRAMAWNGIAEAAHRSGDDKLTWEAIDHSLDDAAELYKRDIDADAPNAALRDQWPSTNAYRRAVITATTAFGVDADQLLLRITDQDLALFARVEMAQALLERPHESWSTSVSRHSK